ncbi:hypothetical protein DRQ50_14610 [bacterium]|nr:MAG: hypothetical protein DRQ50_14610 [bacterium]
MEDGDENEDTFSSRLGVAVDDVHRDWKILSEAEQAASERANYKGAGIYQRQLRTLRGRSLLGRLGTYGLMPKYGFPTDVVELKVRSSSWEAGQVELARDMKLALTEFAPENQVIAAGRVWTSAGIVLPLGERKLHEYLFWHCQACNFFSAERSVATEEETPSARQCHCGEKHEADRYIYPEFGFTTKLGEGARVGDSRPPAKSYAESFFQDESQVREPTPVDSCNWVHEFPATKGWIHVINNNRDRDFYVCTSCGFSALLHPSFLGEKGGHKVPWSTDRTCRGSLVRRALGYCYRTDVVELRFPKPSGLVSNDPDLQLSFWQSLLHAVVNASCLELEIDGRDIDGCLYYREGKTPSIVLFDTSPGGAGFVFEVRDNLGEIMRRTLAVVSCSSCAEDSSCVACLRTYSNQRVHNKLRRGVVLDYLRAQ